MKNSILFLFLALLFSSCMTQSGKYTAYSANSKEGQAREEYKNGKSSLKIKNKTKNDLPIAITCKDITQEIMIPARKNWLRAGKVQVSLTRNLYTVDDHKNTPIRLDVEPYFKYVTRLTKKNSTPLKKGSL